MAIDFPTGPAVNDLYTYNSVTYKWDGVFWSPQLIGAISSFLIDDTINTAVTNFTFTHTTTLTPGTGIGTGISLGAETSSGNVEIGAIIEAVAVDATATSEDFDLRFKTMKAGAAATEVMRLNGDGLVGIGNNGPNYIGRLEVSEPGNLFNLSLLGYANNAWGGGLFFNKTRNATYDGNTIVQNGDNLGYIYFSGNDGTQRRTAAQIFGQVDGVPGAGDMPGRLLFTTSPDGSTTPVERLRIDQAGRVSISNGPVTTWGGGYPDLGISTATGIMSLQRFSTGDTEPYFVFAKSKSATLGGHTAVIADTGLGGIVFVGSDGTDFAWGAEIGAYVDGSPGNNDMPTRLSFLTSPDGSESPAERMRITNYGEVLVNCTAGPIAGEPNRVVIAQPTSDWGLSLCGLSGSGFFGLITSTGGATPTSHTLLGASANIGGWTYSGSDGSQYLRCASFGVNVEGTPSANNMPAAFYFSTGPGGGAAMVQRLSITAKGNIVPGAAALATTATDGFLYVPTCAGTPTGVPTTYTGRVPIVVNTTNNKLYFYSSGAWRDAGP